MQDEPKPPEITLEDLDNSPRTVPAGKSDVPVGIVDINAAFSRVTEENAALKEENAALQTRARTTEILDDLMKPYAEKAFIFMCSYSAFVGLFLLMNAFGCFQQKVETSVLEFLVGSTAVTVIGLVGMVLTGIFVGARKN
ncbi:hypothetical protein [Phaeobacter italicus]|uniref:hypothetical protein n=1 Tax=Phaeobacter italicus TaxID=481446 RepID=UPI001C94451A|nr:hypothetical protein [Phaeobacter italicus]MBY6044147.1 hypothetical protein [Phaeobacter italicus]